MKPSTRPPAIVVIGSSNTDMIIRLPRLPGPGETLLGGRFSTAAGGKGANQAIAAGRAGGKVAFIARVGDDVYGRDVLANLRREKINVGAVSVDRSQPSGIALIFVASNGENSIAVAGGSNLTLTPSDLLRSRAHFRGAAVALLQLETPLPTVIAAARTARRAGATVILNPAPAQKLPGSLLRHVSLLTPNEHEAALLTGAPVHDEATARRAARRLRDRGLKGVIITLGARGAYVSTGSVEALVQSFRVKAVDSTAAGDAFNGALAVAIGEGRGLLDAVRFANAAGALSVTRAGAQPSIPSRAKIDRLLRRARP